MKGYKLNLNQIITEFDSVALNVMVQTVSSSHRNLKQDTLRTESQPHNKSNKSVETRKSL